jgi:hypothetical protein
MSGLEISIFGLQFIDPLNPNSMKKIYLLAMTALLGTAASAQINAPANARKHVLTRENVSNLVPNRQEARSNDGSMRVTILEQDFQTTGNLPGALPTGWTTNDVTLADGASGPSFYVHNATTANAGSYWPVAEVGVNNRFAGANDDAPPCDCLMDEVYVETPSMDFSAALNPAVTFDIYHDGNFGGGDAWLQASTDGGSTWTQVNYSGDVDGLFPLQEGFWQTLVITLFEFGGVADVRLRFTWSDAGSWASGFGVDNVVVGDLEEFSLTLDRTIQGDWNTPFFGDGYWDYTQIPLAQADSVKVTGILSNTGLGTLTNARLQVEIFQGATSVATAETASTPELISLTKDTVSVVTNYIPGAIGSYSITGTAVADEVDADATDNSSSVSFEVSECTYARDINTAQAFFQLEAGDFAGNLFDIYNDEEYYGIQVALGGGSTVGGTVTAVIYELTGFDATTGDPIFEFVDGSQSEEAPVLDEDLNTAGGQDFICLPFENPVTLTAGGVYLAAVAGTDVLRLPVSGSNSVPGSWVYTDADGTYGWTQGIFMIRMIGNCVTCVAPETNVEEQTANTFGVRAMPNPASAATLVTFNLEGSSAVELTVRDITGKLVESFNLGNRAAGNNSFELNVANYEAGVYTYTLSANGINVTNRLVVR